MVISASRGDGSALACARLADALEGMPEGLLLFDAGGRMVAANARAAECLPSVSARIEPGVALARLVCAVARALAPLADRDGLRAMRARLLAAGGRVDDVRLPGGGWLRLGATQAGDGGWIVSVADVSEAKACEAALADCRVVLDNLALGFCLYGPDARVRFVNARYGEVLGVDPSLARPGATMREMLAASVAAGHHGDRSLQSLEDLCLGLIAARQPRRLMMTLATGRLLAFDHMPLADGGWLATFEDITERQGLQDTADFLARHDGLTRLPNRVVLAERLEQEIAAIGRGGRFALLCLNLDHFKSVNDTFGHAIGDALLRAVGERLSASVRETDCVCRLGGDEFAIIQTGLERAEQCDRQAQRLVQAFAAPFHLESHRIAVGISIGIAVAPEDGSHAEVLLRHADAAMGRAKEDGGGTYRLFEQAMDARVQARRAMELDLRQALADGAFELHFQPLVDITAGQVAGFEALLRWPHPNRGMIPPVEFIPLAEDIGLIVPLGEWVLRTACKIASAWPGGQRVAVNVSPVQFNAGLLPGAVAIALAESGLPPRRLELEITESVLLSNNAATLDLLRSLRARGVRISMDDFGTGYSSLSYLRSFPFDKIKIDQSFVRDLEESADSAAIVAAIVGLGRSLGMRVTAEGVETAGQLARLRAAGCDEAQGYFFSRPRPAAELQSMIARIEAEAVSA